MPDRQRESDLGVGILTARFVPCILESTMALPPTSMEDFQELLAEAAKLKTAQIDHKVRRAVHPRLPVWLARLGDSGFRRLVEALTTAQPPRAQRRDYISAPVFMQRTLTPSDEVRAARLVRTMGSGGRRSCVVRWGRVDHMKASITAEPNHSSMMGARPRLFDGLTLAASARRRRSRRGWSRRGSGRATATGGSRTRTTRAPWTRTLSPSQCFGASAPQSRPTHSLQTNRGWVCELR